MEHYKNLISALEGAMRKCLAWQIVGEVQQDDAKMVVKKDIGKITDSFYNARDLLRLSLDLGGEKEDIGDTATYVVSAEGAIGMDPGLEFLTKWLFIPIVDEKLRSKEIDRMMVELEFDEAVEKGMTEEEARKALATKYAEVTGQQKTSEDNADAASRTDMNFCSKCGAKLKSGAKFCRKCGSKVQ